MRCFLFTWLILSVHGAAFPDGWLQLDTTQRWIGVGCVVLLNLIYLIIRPAVHRKINDR